jgi:tetratricopeptide (TPR) repeat protein
MSNAAKLKKKAIELEQKKQFDKALAIYIQFLQESEGSLDDADISLYNRVGDLMLRTGSSSDALAYFEKAVDLYAERGFHNNAIALCNRVLRQAPGRASIYYKLGKISATKGFKSDAKKNFLEYADRMQKAGQIDEAFRALKEFADLCPDQDDIRLMLAEQLTKENRQDEALEQLQRLHDKLDSEGRMAEARATVDRMKSIDPEAVPRKSGSFRSQKSSDLIFLDTSYEDSAREPKSEPTEVPRASMPAPTAAPRAPTPAPTAIPQAPPPRPAVPTPSSRQVSDPDLVLLTFDDQASASEPSERAAMLADPLELDVPNDEAAVSIPLLDIGQELPSADDIGEGFDLDAMASTGQHVSAEPLDFALAAEPAVAIAGSDVAALDLSEPVEAVAIPDPEPTHVESTLEPSTYVAGPSLAVDYGDLAADFTAPPEPDGGDLFDFRSPPRSDGGVMDAAPLLSLDPDVAFPSFDMGDMSLPSADDVTSGADLASALGVDASLSGGLDPLDLDGVGASTNDSMFGGIEPEGSLDLGSSTRDDRLDFDLHGAESLATAETDSVGPTITASASSIDDMVLAGPSGLAADTMDSAAPPTLVPDSEPEIVAAPIVEASSREATPIEVPIDDLIEAPAPVERAPTPAVSAAIRPSQAADAEVATTRSVEPRQAPAVARPAETPAELQPPADHRAAWEIQRAQAERMLEAGERANGVQKLEQVAAELERIGDLERALTIIDELIRLSPDLPRHHQKRVELAFRSNDRTKLIDAYLELGDALFRSGEERKARAVYQRVLELAPDDPRAQAAVDSVASMSPPRGSGAIAAIPAPAQTPDVRSPAPQPASRDSHRAAMPTPSTVVHASNGIGAPAQSHKPSPLDRSAATNGDFIDLGDWLRSGESPKSTRMVAEEKPPTGDEDADFQEMLKRFKQGVAENVDEEDYESHYDLGVAYKEMGLIDEAVAEFQKALRGHSNRVRAYEALGQCFIEKDQYQVAASVLSRAIAIGEGDDHHLVGVLYLLGRATEALSRNRDALDYYQRVFAVDIEFRDVADRVRAIERKAT